MEANRSMPNELVKRVRRRQRLIALASTATVLALVVGVWMGAGSVSQSEAIPPADDNVTEVDRDSGDVEGLAPTQDRLVGLWVSDPSLDAYPDQLIMLLEFNPDRTFAIDSEGRIGTTPVAKGSYDIDHGARTVTFTSEGSRICTKGDTWAWEFTVTGEGRLHAVIVEDGDPACSMGPGTKWKFTRVSPASPESASITSDAPPESGTPPRPSVLPGVWVEEGGGRVLQFEESGTYIIDDAGRLGNGHDDAGAFRVGDNGTLTFTSGSDSRTCHDGAQTVWKPVRFSGRTLRGVVARDDCMDSVGTEMTWILVSR
jgi:hypothetical protein